MKARVRSTAVAAAVIAFAACGETAPNSLVETTPADELYVLLSASADAQRNRSGSSVFDRIAEHAPGFAGMYRVQQCAAVVLLVDGDADEALRIVHAIIGPLVGRSCPHGVRLTAGRAEYTYLQLQAFLSAAGVLVGADGVRAVLLDYSVNRLIVVVASQAVADRAAHALSEAGVPPAAVLFRITAARTRP